MKSRKYWKLCFRINAATAAKSLQLCPTLCDPIDSSLPGSPIPGILQARILAWVAISFSNAWKWKVKVKSLSCVWLLVTPWTAAYQAPQSMGFSRQEYWSGVPLPSPSELMKWSIIQKKIYSWKYFHYEINELFHLWGLTTERRIKVLIREIITSKVRISA